MDVLVLELYAGSAALTLGGTVTAATDVARRVRRYRDTLATAAAEDDSRPTLSPVQELLKERHAFLVAQDVRRERAERTTADLHLAAAAGLTARTRTLVLSTVIALTGVSLGAAADIFAVVRAPGV